MSRLRIKEKQLSNRRGQILVEYLLLMVIAVSCSAILVKALISRDQSKPGIIIDKWQQIIRTIGNDIPDCANQKNFSTPNCP